MVRFRLVHHSLHHTTRYTTPASGVLPVLRVLQLACLPHDEPIFPDNGWWWLGHSLDNNQAVAFGILEPSKQWRTRPTSPERGYYLLGVVKGSSAVLLPFVSVLRAGRALSG
jgi:hypothetical protein